MSLEKKIMQTSATKIKKILILGAPGSGKSELAGELGKLLGIKEQDIHNLDRYFWKPGWKKTSLEERQEILSELMAGSKWIIDGNFFNVVDILLENADYAIFLNISKWTTYWRLLAKWISYIPTGIPEIAYGCKDRVTLKYLRDMCMFRATEGKIIQEKAFKALGADSVKIINHPQELLDFLNELNISNI